MMGIALGGLGVLSLRFPRDVSFHQLVDLPTILLAVLLVAIVFLIAYFSNPSEASLRAFLTELAFRQHLSRLNEAQEGDPDDDDEDIRPAHPIDYKGARKKDDHGHKRGSLQHDSPVVFHFANKASVSLRTPGYRFRSFAVLTFAVVSPTELALVGAQSSRSAPVPSASSPSQRGACFIGAFGHWWFALEMRMHSRHVRIAAHDDASVSVPSSDVSVPRAPDDHREHHSLPRPPRQNSHRAPPRTKAALRERLILHTSGGLPRSTTPPPLPKSASLPLHGPPPAPPLLSASHAPAAPIPTPSPALADILVQIDTARAATSDLYAQLEAYRTPAPAHAALQAAVEAARETKKREDAGRASIKARTKSLEDARRQSDARKREAEKRLKSAVAARDGTTDTIERLERDIGVLRARIVDDKARLEKSREESGEERLRLEEELEAKRTEIGETEEAVGRLAGRARELEEVIAKETKKLETLKAARPRDTNGDDTASVWPPPLSPPAITPSGLSNNSQTYVATTASLDSFSPFSESPTSTLPFSPVSAGLLPNSLVQSMECPRETLPVRTDKAHEDRLRWPISSPQQPSRFPPPLGHGLNPTAKAFMLPSHQRRRLPPDLGNTTIASFPSAPGTSFSSAPGTPFIPSNALGAPFPSSTPFSGSGPATSAPLFNEAATPASTPPAPARFAALHNVFTPFPAELEALQRAQEEGSGSGSAHPSPPIAGRSSVVQSRTIGVFNPWAAND